jgi:hypothetical protein
MECREKPKGTTLGTGCKRTAMYNRTINQTKRETKTNFHQNGFKKEDLKRKNFVKKQVSLSISKKLLPPALHNSTHNSESKELVMCCTPVVMCPSLRIREAM